MGASALMGTRSARRVGRTSATRALWQRSAPSLVGLAIQQSRRRSRPSSAELCVLAAHVCRRQVVLPCARTPLLSQQSAAEAPAETVAVAVQLLFYIVKPGRRTTASSASLPGVEARSQVVPHLIHSIIGVDRRVFRLLVF